MRRTKEDTEATHRALLAAALTVFSRRGYAAARLEDIAREARVTRGAVYHHFGGKAELYNALLEERFGRVNRVWEETLKQGGTPLQMLRRLLTRSLQYLEEDPDYRAVQELVAFKTAMVPELAKGLQRKQRATRGFIGFLAQLVEQGIERGEIRAGVNPQNAALAMMGLVNGVSLIWLLDPHLFSLKERAKKIVDTFLRGVAA